MNNSTESAKSLLQRLINSLRLRDWEDSNVEEAMKERKWLIAQVVNIGEPAVDLLIEFLSHSDWAVRDHIANILGNFKNIKAEKILTLTMLNDTSRAVNLSAASALEHIGSQEALLATQLWYRNNGISKQMRVEQKITEYMLFGETDEELVRRANELAIKRGVTLQKIFIAKSSVLSNPSFSPQKKAEHNRRLGIIELTSQECDYLDELYVLN